MSILMLKLDPYIVVHYMFLYNQMRHDLQIFLADCCNVIEYFP